MKLTSTLTVRGDNTLRKTPNQIFVDSSGRRWAIAKYILSFLLIGLIVIGTAGITSAYKSTKSLIELQASENTPDDIHNKYPVFVDTGSIDYPHLKEYHKHFSSLIVRGKWDGSNEQHFSEKYLNNIPKWWQLTPDQVRKKDLDEIKDYGFAGVVLSNYNSKSIPQAVELLSKRNIKYRFVASYDEELLKNRVENYTHYLTISIEDIQNGISISDRKNIIPIFEFTAQNDQGALSPVEFSNSLTPSNTIFYDKVGFVGDTRVVNTIVIQNLLKRNKITNYGLDGLEFIDSRWFAGDTLHNYHVTNYVQTKGHGEFFTLVRDSAKAKVQYTWQGDTIIEEKFLTLPQLAVIQRHGVRENQINLSFDDGPDPDYTPQILDILKQENIQATFYVTGINVRKYPDIARRIVADGHIIANHTYLHPRTWQLDPQTFKNEVVQTQNAIRDITGVEAKFFRTPYNDTDNYSSNIDLQNIRILTELGLQVSEWDVDTKDWTKPGVKGIVENVNKELEEESVSQILFHDGGGTRDQTIESLPKVIQLLQENEYKFVSLVELYSGIDSSSVASVNLTTNTLTPANGLVSFFAKGISWYATIFAYIMFAKLIITLFLIGLVISSKNKYTNAQPGVSVIVPCYNEGKLIRATIHSILQSNYPLYEVIVVNDGSTDDTTQILKEFEEESRVKIIHKQNTGKSSAINTGVASSKFDFVVFMDGDSIMPKDTLSNLMRNFYSDEVGGVAGNIHIGNYDSFLTQTQRAEYIYGQSFDKEIYGYMNSIPVVPGALGAWRKELVIQAGGLNSQTLAEDTDLTLRIRKLGQKIIFDRQSIVITEAPATIGEFIKQRKRWMYGTLQCIWKHKDMVLNYKYGYLGLVVLPEIILSFLFLGMMVVYLYSIIMLLVNVTISVINTRADISELISSDTTRTLMFVAGSLGIYYITNILALLLDNNKNKWEILWYLPYQMIVYRGVLWGVQCLVVLNAIQGREQGWNHLQRKGLRITQ